jgi:AhpD family alkylhydroperoxidase
MDDYAKKLIALGASAAANCRPCLEHHLGQARAAAVSPEDIAEAVDIGLAVNEGAARQTRAFVDDTLLGSPVGSGTAAGRCC